MTAEISDRGVASGAALTPAWQPIETAPRDGARVLLYHPGYKDWFYPRDEQPRWWVDHWHQGAWYHTAPSAQPTHWMPLPPPPGTVQTPQAETK